MRGGDPGRRPDGVGRVRSSVLRALVPLAFAALMWWLGHTGPAAVLVALAFVLLVIGLAAPAVGQAIDRFVERVGVAAANGLAVVLGALAWALLVLPIWALSWLVKYSPLEDGWATATTNWVRIGEDRTRTPNGLPVRPTRMGARDPSRSAPVRRRGALRYLVLLPILAIVLLVSMPSLIERFDLPGPQLGPADLRSPAPDEAGIDEGSADDGVTWMGLPVDDYAHENEPWAQDFFRELQNSGGYHDLMLGQRLRDVDGEHLNIVDGRRVSYQPSEPELEVWFFGGSTIYGIGQRDNHTIPSEVARLAESDGFRIEAVNFGVSGYVNWVETIRYAEELAQSDAPDLVVFYDGANDEAVGHERIAQGNVDVRATDRLTLSEAEREAHTYTYGAPPDLDNEERAALFSELVGAQYGRGVRTARLLAAGSGSPILHFWQPVAISKIPSPADDELLRRLGYTVDHMASSRENYAAARERSGVDPIDLSSALDGVDVPVFFDWGHTNELGARIVAEAMYEHVRPQLEAVSASRG